MKLKLFFRAMIFGLERAGIQRKQIIYRGVYRCSVNRFSEVSVDKYPAEFQFLTVEKLLRSELCARFEIITHWSEEAGDKVEIFHRKNTDPEYLLICRGEGEAYFALTIPTHETLRIVLDDPNEVLAKIPR